ncbi:MAG TPA: ShlB/FhaC/HecB family hemolysin secretion/activation protein, partial [Ferruginibacter sp.]|nr:ShlB/FhaC/HecB family hemolysin secretion/activation protein [Ferruginibacter sp.]
KQYYTGNLHQSLWGKHYRREWNTPVRFNVVKLDTLAGGLTPYEAGGGRQSKSLRLRDNNGREYVLRSIDKTFGRALPEIFQGSFIEKIADDQVSIGHPYSAVTVAPLAETAKILHTNPMIIYVPKQERLGKFSDDYGDELYLFEQRPDENWDNAPNFGNSAKIISTEKLMEELQDDNDNRVDQVLYVRSRIFDMFIGDWGRHEDQWRWASHKEDGKTIYQPIPRDRDQSYTKFDGLLLGFIKPGRMQTFAADIKNVNTFNYPARHLDRRMANEVTLQQWLTQARELKQLLTDAVIESSVKQMPAETFPISGNEIIAKLKSRRDHLEEYARTYYLFLAKEIDVTGSMKREQFEVKRSGDGSTTVSIYKINKEGELKDKPIYSRVFYKHETKEIRLYGLGAEDKYEISGNAPNAITVRLIGGPDKDEYHDVSVVSGSSKETHIYDNPGNSIGGSRETRTHLETGKVINTYQYDEFTYDKKGFKPSFFYSNEDHIYVGLKYGIKNFKWRKRPFGSSQNLYLRYSITEKGFSAGYDGKFIEAVGKWDLDLNVNFDQVRWYNYYGLGNETEQLKTNDRLQHRLRTQEFITMAGLSRNLGGHHKLGISGSFQTVQIKNDTVFVKGLLPPNPNLYSTSQFAAAEVEYSYQAVNDSFLPTKGVGFVANISYTDNLKNSNNFLRYSAWGQVLIPFTKTLGLVMRVGGASLTGTPEFYQYNFIGGGKTLRGYRRTRFFGKTTAYSQNELRWIKNVRSYLYNGKIGLLALYDIGRVWIPGEKSNTWH